jgi:hypothetical protein
MIVGVLNQQNSSSKCFHALEASTMGKIVEIKIKKELMMVGAAGR